MAKARDAFRTISEVSETLDTPAHVLRFWESKFAQVKPVKRAGGRRYYRPDDIALLGGIKTLLHDQGMTIKGAQKLLRSEGIKHVAALYVPADDLSDDPDVIDHVIPETPAGEAAHGAEIPDAPASTRANPPAMEDVREAEGVDPDPPEKEQEPATVTLFSAKSAAQPIAADGAAGDDAPEDAAPEAAPDDDEERKLKGARGELFEAEWLQGANLAPANDPAAEPAPLPGPETAEAVARPYPATAVPPPTISVPDEESDDAVLDAINETLAASGTETQPAMEEVDAEVAAPVAAEPVEAASVPDLPPPPPERPSGTPRFFDALERAERGKLRRRADRIAPHLDRLEAVRDRMRDGS